MSDDPIVNIRPGTSTWSEPTDAFIERPDWHALANCGRNGPIGHWPAERRIAYMFPGKGKPIPRHMCADCPVRDQCTIDGRNERFGVWGGTTERQRRIARSPGDDTPISRELEGIMGDAWMARSDVIAAMLARGTGSRESASVSLTNRVQSGVLEQEQTEDGTLMLRLRTAAA